MAPVNRNLVMQSRRALYQLKKDYGAEIDIYKLINSETDVRTGEKVITRAMYPIRRAVVMPETKDRVAQQSISLISSNKEFVTGGTYDVGVREFIVDRRDCPTLPELGADDWIVYNGHKYQIKKCQSFEVDAGWVISAKRLDGEVPEQIFIRRAHSLLQFVQVAVATVETP